MQILALESYSLSLFALPPMLTASTMLALGVNVLRREGGSRVSLSFFIMTLTGAVWLSSYALMYCARNAGVAAVWGHLGHVGITFIPAAVYNFAAIALQIYRRHRLRVWLTWTISAAFLLSALAGDTLVAGVRLHWWGYYPLYGWMGAIFVGFFLALMAISLREYWSAWRSALPGASKFRSQALFAAFCIAYVASVDYLAAFGIPVYPFGYLAVLGFVVVVGHTIGRYRLMSTTPELAAREILEAIDDALLIFDTEGVVRVGNQAACRIFRRSKVAIEGVSVAELAGELKGTGERLAEKITEGSLRDHECAASGGARTLSLSSFALRDKEGASIGTICMIRDITEARATERQIDMHTRRQAALYELNLAATSTLELRTVLHALLDRLEPLVPGAAMTVLLLDQSGQGLRKVTCRGIDETAWKSAPRRELAIHPTLRLKETVESADIREFPGGGLDYVFFSSRGFCSYLGFPLIAQNRVIGVLSFYSRQQRFYSDEEKTFLRTLCAQAAVAIHNSMLYGQIRRQATALEKANRVRDDFLSVMSHELRTPLNVISGYTRLVQEGVMGDVSPEQYKALDKVGRHTNELLFMVSSIMNAAKIEGGALELDPQEFLVTELLDEVKALYDYPRGKDVALDWDYPGDLPPMRSDRDKLKHVVQNLINNALKFTDSGSVTVTARQSRDQGVVEITVTDSGIGIPAEDLPLIFDRFRQVDSSKTRAHGGVGLGLHIVRTFTNLLGGQIKVNSTCGQGSTFTITLPSTAPRHAGADAGRIH
jgi:PAS domain S-box-containing protein